MLRDAACRCKYSRVGFRVLSRHIFKGRVLGSGFWVLGSGFRHMIESDSQLMLMIVDDRELHH